MWMVAVAFGTEPVSPEPERVPLIVDAKVPVELVLEGMKLGELLVPAEVTFQVPVGAHVLRVYVGGSPTDLALQLTSEQTARIVVGRTGISTNAAPVRPIAEGLQPVEFRLIGASAASVRLDAAVHALDASSTYTVALSPGAHPLSVRSADGTAVWATGHLVVSGGKPIVVQVSEGRLPEVSGPASFRPTGS